LGIGGVRIGHRERSRWRPPRIDPAALRRGRPVEGTARFALATSDVNAVDPVAPGWGDSAQFGLHFAGGRRAGGAGAPLERRSG
jgi:hypothetical protein